jgi:hypothetical protein
MKISGTGILLCLLLAGTMACSKKEAKSAEASSDEWPQMDAFHMIMAEAYHPYKDSSNVEPARRLAEEMAKSAETWNAAPLPEKVNNDDVKAQLDELVIETREFADKIKAGAGDDEIGATLTALHDSFHQITEAWHGSMEKHEH